jgi:hypothetical protein
VVFEDNDGMIKYDFNNNELWFSGRALRELACADRLGFDRHIKNTERTAMGEGGISSWGQDIVYLSRMEGGRTVHRKSVIFNLETAYLIARKFQKHTPPDYWMVLRRFEELIGQKKTAIIDKIKASNSFHGVIDDSIFEDKEYMEMIKALYMSESKPKKRTILDFSENTFKLVIEGKEEKKELWPRAMFRFSV